MSDIIIEPKTFHRDLLAVKVYPTIEQMGAAAAVDVSAAMVELLGRKEELNIIFASAPSQEEFLGRLAADPRIDWTRVNAFHMDEYIGVEQRSPHSFGNFLRVRLFDRLPFRSVNYMNGATADVGRECERYAELLRRFPPDIVCLGIGENGHIAFNDPPVADFNDPATVKVVTLDEVCRRQQVNEKCFERLDNVPVTAMTITIPGLLGAGLMFCIVPFAGKAEAVRNTLFGEVSERCPASILRRKENACLYLNADSARLIM
jgi:glucosamine-6-phosphate deaminase